jgi:hypothetical protein
LNYLRMSRFAISRRKYAYILLKLTTPTNIAKPIPTTDTNALAILARLDTEGTKYNTARNIPITICAYSGASRPPIPEQAGHPLERNSDAG